MNINPHIFRAYDIRGIAEVVASPAVRSGGAGVGGDETKDKEGSKVGESGGEGSTFDPSLSAGPIEVDLTAEFAEQLGKAFGTYIATHYQLQTTNCTIAVSRDNRPHGIQLMSAFIKGLLSTGCNVVELGELPTPLLYFAVCKGVNVETDASSPSLKSVEDSSYAPPAKGELADTVGGGLRGSKGRGLGGGVNVSAGVSITASHNPKEYNGFKFVGPNATSICGKEIQEIKSILEMGAFKVGEGMLSHESIAEDYGKHMIQNHLPLLSSTPVIPSEVEESPRQIPPLAPPNQPQLSRNDKKLKIVVDCANGIAGQIYPHIFKALGMEVVELFCESDGTFPNHEPDPIVESNLSTLKAKVKESGAHLGLAFDGDGDRVSLVDEHGVYHDANQTLVLLAKDVLSRNPQASVVYTVSCSSIVPQEVARLGGKSHMVPVGHSFVEQAMHTHHALLGGEQSGHFFLAENYYPFDDACFTACRLLSMFSASLTPVSSHYSALPKVYDLPERRPHCPDDEKFAVIERVERSLSKKYPVNTLDGVRADFGNGAWAGIRASNTSPCLSVCMEASSKDHLKEIESVVKTVLLDEGVVLEYQSH